MGSQGTLVRAWISISKLLHVINIIGVSSHYKLLLLTTLITIYQIKA